jgi:integrase
MAPWAGGLNGSGAPQVGALGQHLDFSRRWLLGSESAALLTKLMGGDGSTRGDDVRIGGLDPVSKLIEMTMRRKAAEKKAGDVSLSKYESVVRVHLLPKLGSHLVENLDVAVVDDFLMTLNASAPSQARRAKVVLIAMVKIAVAHKAIPNNFMSATFVPPTEEKEIVILTLPQINKMLAAVDSWRQGPHRRDTRPDGRLGKVLRVALGSGLRIGEVVALRRMDVKPPEGGGAPWLVTVSGTVIVPDKGAIFRQAKPKTKNSRRTVPVAGFAGAVLESLMEETADGGLEHPLFTTRTGGGWVSPANLRRSWRRIRGQDDLEDLLEITPHALRRAVGTMLSAEVSPEYAAKYLGHGHGTAVLFAHYVKYVNTVDDIGSGTLDALMPPQIER